MSNVRTMQRSFGGGEVTPEFWGRIDDSRYQTGLARCMNFIVKPQGPVENRAGTVFVREVKDSTKATRVMPFTFSAEQTMVLEVGEGYLRFHTTGATLMHPAAPAYDAGTAYETGDLVASGGVTYYCIKSVTGTAPPDAKYWYALPASGEYEIPTPYLAGEIYDIKYAQSADVMTLVHVGHSPMELRRLGAAKWVLVPIAFNSRLTPPSGVSATASGGTGTTYRYVVTCLGEMESDESIPSAEATCNGNLFASGGKNTITWSAASGVATYCVYKFSGGMFGYVGRASSTTFVDDNIAADTSRTPPVEQTLFGAEGDYPGAVSYFEQRRAFAGTINQPQNLWMTKSGTESNMNYSLPVRDDDSIQLRVAAREATQVRHIVPLVNLLLLTSGAEWRVTSVNSDAVTPSTIAVAPQSYIGCSEVTPVVIANNIIYAAARGGHLREMAYSSDANGYVSGDLSLRAPHLFDELVIRDMAYAKAPYPIVWAVSSSGNLLGLTYLPEQQVGAWHQHQTQGAFESVTVVPEGQDDVPYFVVRRTVGGVDKRYIEFLRPRHFVDPQDAYFVDCGLTYSGVPAGEITGLDHLEGETVAVLGDGAVMPRCKVSGGKITLAHAVSKAHVGLPITSEMQTLPVSFEAPGFGQGLVKNVNQVWLRVYRSGGIFTGPTFDKLTEAKQRTTEAYGSPPELKTDELRLTLDPTWARAGQICLRQADPLPLTVTSMALDVTLGGA